MLIQRSVPTDVDCGRSKRRRIMTHAELELSSADSSGFEAESDEIDITSSDEVDIECSHDDSVSTDDEEHIRKMQNKKNDLFRCTYPGCGSVYKKPSKLAQHNLVHTGERPFKCTAEGCDKSYRRAAHLAVHALTHGTTEEERKPYKCSRDGCPSAFGSRHHLSRHEKLHDTAKPYICSFEGCTESFTKQTKLRKHMGDHTGQKPYACTYEGCTKSFPTPSKLRDHSLTHNAILRYVCSAEGCGVSFEKWSLLQAHAKSHRKGFCGICERKFASKETLKEHMETHKDAADREYIECAWPTCDQVFTQFKNMKKHVATVHRDLRPYACTFGGCESTFGHKHLLARHLRTHEKPAVKKKRKDAIPEPSFIGLLTGAAYCAPETGRVIPCSVTNCRFAFRREYDLQRHIKAKHRESASSVDECGIVPELDATRILPCAADGCSLKFKRRIDLQRHIRGKHSEIISF